MFSNSLLVDLVLMVEVVDGQLLQEVGREAKLLAVSLLSVNAATHQFYQSAENSEKAFEQEAGEKDEHAGQHCNSVQLLDAVRKCTDQVLVPAGHELTVLDQQWPLNFV